MALPGLNTEGTNIRVLPQYTPSNTALDFSALGSGFSQGLGLVQQAQQARRLRDIMAEEEANAPLRRAMRLRDLEMAQLPIERSAGIGIERTPGGDLVEIENIEAFVPGGQPYRTTRPSRVLETAAQAASRDRAARPLAPLREIIQNPDGTFDSLLISRQPGEEGQVVGRVKGVTPQQTFVPDAPKPQFKSAGFETIQGPGGQPFKVAVLEEVATGNRFYEDAEGNRLPLRVAPAPVSGGNSSAQAFIQSILGTPAQPTASGLPGLVAPTQATPAPATNVIRVDPSTVYGTR